MCYLLKVYLVLVNFKVDWWLINVSVFPESLKQPYKVQCFLRLQGKFQLICAKKKQNKKTTHLCESNKLCQAPTQPPHCAAHYLTCDILHRNIEQDCSESRHLVVMDCLSVSTASSLLPPVSFGLDHSDFSFCCPPFFPLFSFSSPWLR